MNRERIREARLVANPGCYPTAVQLGFLPLVESGRRRPRASDRRRQVRRERRGPQGRSPHAVLRGADNFKAYGVPGHRHMPEIAQGLSAMAGRAGRTRLRAAPDADDPRHPRHAVRAAHQVASTCRRCIEKRYADEPFVDVLPPGSHPDTRSVRGANVCRIAVHQPQGGDIVVVLSVIDNLVKGAAGQAVQNMNIMFGLPRDDGTRQVALLP